MVHFVVQQTRERYLCHFDIVNAATGPAAQRRSTIPSACGHLCAENLYMLAYCMNIGMIRGTHFFHATRLAGAVQLVQGLVQLACLRWCTSAWAAIPCLRKTLRATRIALRHFRTGKGKLSRVCDHVARHAPPWHLFRELRSSLL